MSISLILAEVAASQQGGHRVGIVAIVAGAVIIVAGLLRLFRLLPSRRSYNPVISGGLSILAGLVLLVLGIVLTTR